MAEWIRCTERMPEMKIDYDVPEDGVRFYRSDSVLVYVRITDGTHVDIGECVIVVYPDKAMEEWNTDTYVGEVTHWMPLPEPPKEGGGEDGN